MKIGVISDSHDHIERVRAAAEIFRARGAETIIHCGDFVAPFILKPFKDLKFTDCLGVFGNNDGEKLWLRDNFKDIGRIAKPPVFVEKAGRRLAVLHEPMPDDVMDALPVDVVLFGHTHEIVNRKAGAGAPLVLNPGESCGWLTGRATAMILDTEALVAELIELP